MMWFFVIIYDINISLSGLFRLALVLSCSFLRKIEGER